MREESCCFTGHRNLRGVDLPRLEGLLEEKIRKLMDRGITNFLAGGARGFDLLAARTVLRLREQGEPARLILILPCRDQDRGWSLLDRQAYSRTLEQADKVLFLSGKYQEGCMFLRNRYLVDHSSVCVCYLAQSRGGTLYTVNYAKRQGLELYNLAPRLNEEI